MMAQGLVIQFIHLLNLLLWMPTTMMHYTVFASVIESLRSRPLDEIRFEQIFSDVRRRIGLDAAAGLTRTMLRLSAYYFRAELKRRVGQGDLAFQIAFHEGRSPGEIHDRCLALSRATKRSYDWIRVFILASLLLPPVVEAALVFCTASRNTRLSRRWIRGW
jgi:hypothetical protein